jgi:putative hydrolase of the HAD superfamily
VLLDAFGTLVTFDDPAPKLRAAVRERIGRDVGLPAATAAMRAEIAYYRLHHEEGRDADSVAALRRRCGAVVAAELAVPGLTEEAATGALIAAIEWRAYAEVAPVLAGLRARGIRLAVVSNWDAALGEVLGALGLEPFFEVVLASAPEGRSKPDPELFRRALARVGVEPHEAIHVGDSEEHDVLGARAAGIEPVLLRRSAPTGPRTPMFGVRTISTLRELTDHWA